MEVDNKAVEIVLRNDFGLLNELVSEDRVKLFLLENFSCFTIAVGDAAGLKSWLEAFLQCWNYFAIEYSLAFLIFNQTVGASACFSSRFQQLSISCIANS